MLYLIPTPIGNLGDLTYRAVAVLKEVDVILCEDTRTSGVLLKHYEISKPLSAYHLHNEHGVTPRLVAQMQEGKTFALLTDAGTPGISDPGYFLLRECLRNEIKVDVLPGATAILPALLLSGFPPNAFCFEGFLPQKKGRQTALKALVDESRTMVFYESPHRLLRSLKDMAEHFGDDRQASVSRELTKKFEETKRGTIAELHTYFTAHPVKGEIVMVVCGADKR